MIVRGVSSTFRASGSQSEGAGANPAPRSIAGMAAIVRSALFIAALVFAAALLQAALAGNLRQFLIRLLPALAGLLGLAVLVAAQRRTR